MNACGGTDLVETPFGSDYDTEGARTLFRYIVATSVTTMGLLLWFAIVLSDTA